MDKTPLRVGLYGGTFDPIHHGHLILARDAIEHLGLDRVIFIPATRSPHKPGCSPTPGALRRKMLAAALADEPGFELDDSELTREGFSYSIDTVEQIHARLPEAELFYLIGSDHLPKLHTWRRVDELLKLVKFAVFARGEATPSNLPENLQLLPLATRRIDLSASEIRLRVAQGLSIRYFVPDPVRSIIESTHLYKENSH